MNRKIEFRGKCSHCDAWAYGSLVDYGENEAPEIHGFDPYREGDERWREITVDHDTVGQFTGLHDKNGTPIYEGDVIQSPLGNVVVVEYGYKEHNVRHGKPAVTDCFAAYGWIARNVKNGITDFLDSGFLKGMVIGNIYDNQDLLNQK